MFAPAVPIQSSGRKLNWLLGSASSATLGRLWGRYLEKSQVVASKSASASPQQATHEQLSTHPALSLLNRLGCVADLAPAESALKTGFPSLLSDPQQLNKIESTWRDDRGRSLQRFLADDISSRVLIEVVDRCPESGNWIEEAMSLLHAIVPARAKEIEERIYWIIPIYHEKHNRPFRRGFSHIDFLGAVFTSFVERLDQPQEIRRSLLAMDLCHELGHQALMLYQLADPIFVSNADALVYSSVRRTSRPAILSLHACVAAAYMMEVAQGVLTSDKTELMERKFSANTLQELGYHQRSSLSGLRAAGQFTEIGERILVELESQLENLATHFPELFSSSALEAFSKEPATTVGANPRGDDPSKLSYFGLLRP